MTALEDKLRNALTATADLVTPASLRPDDAPDAARSPRRLPRPPGLRRSHEPGPRRRSRVLVPVLVAVVVLVLVGGIVALIRPLGGDDGRVLPAAVPATSPARHFVTTLMGGSHLDEPYQELTVRDAVTGAVTAVLPPPDDSAWLGVSATADPQTFFVLSVPKSLDMNVPPPVVRAPNRLHRLVISADGQVRSRTPIESLGTPQFTAFAASPDGTRLAVLGSFPSISRGSDGITIVDVGSGRTQTFATEGDGGLISSIAWSADGRHLAYRLHAHQTWRQFPDGSAERIEAKGQGGILILDTTLGGGDLIASSRRVTSDEKPAISASPFELALNADGTRVYTVMTRHGQNPYVTKSVVELDAATGRQVRVLLNISHDYSLITDWTSSSLTSDPTGQILMLSDGGADYHRIDLTTGQTTRLPTTVNRGHPNGLAW